MSESVYNNLIASFEQPTSFRDYKNAFMQNELRYGSLRGKEWKAAVFILIAGGAVWYYAAQHFRLSELPVSAVVFAIGIFMAAYYLFIVPARAASAAGRIYSSSKYISAKKKYSFYRDHFTYRNDCEYLKRYYTDITDCIETKDTFILIGGIECRIIVICKEALVKEQLDALGEHFRNELVRQYRNVQ